MTPFVWQVDVEWENGLKKRVKCDKNDVIPTADAAAEHCRRVLAFTDQSTLERVQVKSVIKVSDDPTPIGQVDVTHAISKKIEEQLK